MMTSLYLWTLDFADNFRSSITFHFHNWSSCSLTFTVVLFSNTIMSLNIRMGWRMRSWFQNPLVHVWLTNKKEKRSAILSFILTLLDIIQSCWWKAVSSSRCLHWRHNICRDFCSSISQCSGVSNLLHIWNLLIWYNNFLNCTYCNTWPFFFQTSNFWNFWRSLPALIWLASHNGLFVHEVYCKWPIKD